VLCTLCFVLCKIDYQVGQPETALRGKKHKKFPMPKLTLLGTGTQHAVLHSDDVMQEDVVHHGRVLRQHSLFQPLGTNVNFVQTMDTSRIAVRTYEKGVEAETLSCGTGAVAAVAVMTLLNEIEPPVMVHTRSGETFCVNFTRNGSVIRGVTLEGSAHIVYDGEFLEENVD